MEPAGIVHPIIANANQVERRAESSKAKVEARHGLQTYCVTLRRALQEVELRGKLEGGDKDSVEKALSDALDRLDKNQTDAEGVRVDRQKVLGSATKPITANVHQVEPREAKAEDDEVKHDAKYDALQRGRPKDKPEDDDEVNVRNGAAKNGAKNGLENSCDVAGHAPQGWGHRPEDDDDREEREGGLRRSPRRGGRRDAL